jgi:glutamine synthetase adenylyltransferase
MWFDFSPMRIDDYYRQEAQRWNEMLTLRAAAINGIESARDEKRATSELLTMPGG